MKKHKVILIGCGIMAQQHIARFEAVADKVEISAVVDIVKERAQAVSDLLENHPPVFTDYHDALPYGDAVLQSMPHHLHAQCVIDCLDAGLHVLSEKPLAKYQKITIETTFNPEIQNKVQNSIISDEYDKTIIISN